jgi:hypothetical protein
VFTPIRGVIHVSLAPKAIALGAVLEEFQTQKYINFYNGRGSYLAFKENRVKLHSAFIFAD